MPPSPYSSTARSASSSSRRPGPSSQRAYARATPRVPPPGGEERRTVAELRAIYRRDWGSMTARQRRRVAEALREAEAAEAAEQAPFGKGQAFAPPRRSSSAQRAGACTHARTLPPPPPPQAAAKL
jgi:hypothetical protein